MVRHPDEWEERHIYEKRVSTPHMTAWVLRALLRMEMSEGRSGVARALRYMAGTQKGVGALKCQQEFPLSHSAHIHRIGTVYQVPQGC